MKCLQKLCKNFFSCWCYSFFNMLQKAKFWVPAWSCRLFVVWLVCFFITALSDKEHKFVLDILQMPRFMHPLDEMEASRSGMACQTAVSIHFLRLTMVQKCVLFGSLAMGRYITMPCVWQSQMNRFGWCSLDWIIYSSITVKWTKFAESVAFQDVLALFFFLNSPF